MKLPPLPPGFVRTAMPLLAIASAIVSGILFGLEIGLLVAAFGALSAVIAFVWASVQNLTGDSPLTLDEALTLGQPSVEEEQKRAVLRALKDLDYERSVGKISDDDYHDLSARYREEAKRLIQRVDENLTPARERAEKLLAERIAREALAAEAKQKKREKEADDTAGDHDDDETPPASGDAPGSTRDEEERA